jgi:hypothetical protein
MTNLVCACYADSTDVVYFFLEQFVVYHALLRLLLETCSLNCGVFLIRDL